ncbi:hypothetical protein B0H14DRAFT_3750179 [Mycena olivaceomarginata]|nr:hypothetical protein B0H14DRAFT_3750179 [Mycena olivaceomarginata]
MKEFPQELIDRVLDLFVTPDLVHSPFVAGPREIGDLGLILLVDKAEMGLFSQSFNQVCLFIHVHEDGDSSPQSLVSILGTTIPTISWLILSFRTLSSSGIVEVMTCFPGLKELGLGPTFRPQMMPYLHADYPHASTSSGSAFRRWFPPILRNIKLGVDSMRTGGGIEAYFRRHGHEIHVMGLEGASRWGLPVHCALKHTPNLQKLSIVGELPLLDVLSAVSSQQLKSIRIYYTMMWAGDELQVGSSWADVDTALAASKFLRLKSFLVHGLLPVGRASGTSPPYWDVGGGYGNATGNCTGCLVSGPTARD